MGRIYGRQLSRLSQPSSRKLICLRLLRRSCQILSMATTSGSYNYDSLRQAYAAVLIAHLSTTGQIVAAAIEGRPMDDVTAVTPYSALNLSFYAVAGDGVELHPDTGRACVGDSGNVGSHLCVAGN